MSASEQEKDAAYKKFKVAVLELQSSEWELRRQQRALDRAQKDVAKAQENVLKQRAALFKTIPELTMDSAELIDMFRSEE